MGEQNACQIKPGGRACVKPGNHQWGPVVFCCDHFNEFVAGMLDLKDAVNAAQHRYFVQRFNSETRNTSLAEGSRCDAELEPPADSPLASENVIPMPWRDKKK